MIKTRMNFVNTLYLILALVANLMMSIALSSKWFTLSIKPAQLATLVVLVLFILYVIFNGFKLIKSSREKVAILLYGVVLIGISLGLTYIFSHWGIERYSVLVVVLGGILGSYLVSIKLNYLRN